MTAPPSITNYSIPTGKAYFIDDANTTAGAVDLGNVVDFSITNSVTTKDHIRTYGGSRKKDKTIITQVGGDAKFTLDEISVQALAMFGLGDIQNANTDGSFDITALTRTEFTGVLSIVGDNDVGPQIDWIGYVSLAPSGELFFIRNNDDWNTIPITASIQQHNTYGFGKYTIRTTGAGLV